MVDRTAGPARAALAGGDRKRSSGLHRTFNRILVLTGLAWTAFCIGSLAYHAVEARRQVELLARHEAGESISKDMLYRLWAAEHGGVYVPVTAATPPNPYLQQIADRDLTTAAGKRLTLMNPAYMTRQVHELERARGGWGHITSEHPLRPENGADAWELAALQRFARGEKEFGEIVVLGGEPHYRLMRPLSVERSCLKCHAAQGYRLGDLRGGISTAIPMSGFAATARQHLAAEGRHFGSVWALGFAGVLLGAAYVRRRIDERESAIEAQRQADEQRLKLESQLQQAQRLESVGRLAGGVAHDFNNMLQTILGCAHLALLEAPQQGSLREKISEIQNAAEKSADLTRQLLTFARRQAGAPRPLDLNVPIEGMLTMLRRLIGETIDLSWTPGPGLWQVRMDPVQVDQILVNLCVNARDAIAGVGRIVIETHNVTLDAAACVGHPGSAPGDYVLLRVSDDGGGIGEEAASHIFEPFFTTKGVGEGTGLGLAIVHGIVTQHGGFIEVGSAAGRGTTFSIRVPRCAADETATLAGRGGGGHLESS